MTDTLWYTRCPVPTAFSLAIRLGWLDDEFRGDGIAVQSLRQSTDRATRESHFTHAQPGSFRHGGHIPPLWARATGRDVRLIGLSWSEEFQPLVTLPGSGVATLAELRGKRLPLPVRAGEAIDFWRATILRGYSAALGLAGLTLADVDLVPVAVERSFIAESAAAPSHDGSLWSAAQMRAIQREEAIALIRGEVDALFSPGSVGADLVAFLGARVLVDLAASADIGHRVNNPTLLAFTVDGALLDRRPDIVARVLARSLAAAEWAKANRAKTRRIIAAEVGIAEELVATAYGAGVSQTLAPDLSVERLGLLDRQGGFLQEHGFIPRYPGHAEWIEDAPLAEARRLLKSGELSLATA